MSKSENSKTKTKNFIKLNLKVPKDFYNEWLLKEAKPEDTAKVLSLGIQCFHDMRRRAISDLQSDDIKKYTDELDRRYADKEHAVESQIKQCQYENEQLQEKIKQQQISLSSISERQETEMQDRTQYLRTEIDRLKQELNTARDVSASVVESYTTKLESVMGILHNSSKKGKVGETIAMNELKSMFPTAEIEDVHKKNYCGDFHITLDNCKILFENKRYKQNVRKEEVAKFIRDVVNTNVDGGILASQTSNISSKPNFTIDILENKKPVIYVCNIQEESYEILQKAMCALLSLVKDIKSSNSLEYVDKVSKAKDITASVNQLTEIKQSITANLKNSMNDVARLDTSIHKLRLELDDMWGGSPPSTNVVTRVKVDTAGG